MDREGLLAIWDAWWEGNIGVAPWSKALELTAAQAAWKPGPRLHSIWQNVNHIIFWHGYILDRLAGGDRLADAEVRARNFVEPEEATEDAWRSAREEFAASYRAMRAAIADEGNDPARLRDFVPHDAYHLGQIMHLRALQGLAAIE